MSSNVIYGLHAGDGVIRYVGLSTRGAQFRLMKHWECVNAGETTAVYQWMRKHGKEQIVSVVLEECEQSALAEREIHWIKKLGTFRVEGGLGLNLTRGGDGTFGRVYSDETRKKISDAAKARPLTKERVAVLRKAAEAKRGVPRTDEFKKNQSEKLKGRVFTDEWRAKLSAAKKNTDTHTKNLKRAAHQRWHVNRNLINADCVYCGEGE